jgi:hypothetical protein
MSKREACVWCHDDTDNILIVSNVKAHISCRSCGSGRGFLSADDINKLLRDLKDRVSNLEKENYELKRRVNE